MCAPRIPRARIEKDWTPTESSLQQFLHWLDEGVDSGGQKYLEMRRRLVTYFDRKNCLSADELADETLSRVAQKLQEKGSITGMALSFLPPAWLIPYQDGPFFCHFTFFVSSP
jgi:hypothetical protein